MFRPIADRNPDRTGMSFAVTGGLSAVVMFFFITGIVAYLNTRTISRSARQVAETHEVISTLDDVMSLMKDAETGQRGYIITGEERYLEPYMLAVARVDERLRQVERLTAHDPEQSARTPGIRAQIEAKLKELDETIQLRRTRGFEPARVEVVSDRGKATMDAIRDQIGEMERVERETRIQRLAAADDAYRVAIITGILTGMLGVGLSMLVNILVRRAMFTRLRQDWLQSGQVGVSEAVSGDKKLEQLGHGVLGFLAEYIGAQAGAFYAKDGTGFRRVATYGVPPGGAPDRFEVGDGLLGQAATDGKPFVLSDVPPGYITVGSALGQGVPRHLVVSPAKSDGEVVAVFELGFVHRLRHTSTELLERVSGVIGVAVRSARYRAHLQELLEETQRQAEELQAQGEELRVSNEELEEQGRALKDSQARLEQQHAELEQTNSQLEEQTQLLEVERDALARAQGSLQSQTKELERASRYKTDFLANMSHELRTPLNSSLILAKLLADNPAGNLTTEQVKFADTIRSAGNDLLALINDILDLSKIEAGHMEVRPETVPLSRLVDDLGRTFEPLASDKGLKFRTKVSPGCPEAVDTDRQRLEQVLKNLVSNAIKFTEKGDVTLTVSRAEGGRLAFAVSDTGIGIPEHQQQVVFEAFRQADGTTNRKYGGTGLGLSISRELARLLGGEIHLASEPERGSTFTVTIPEQYNAALVRPKLPSLAPSPPVPMMPAALPASAPKAVRTRFVADDREKLTGSGRVILVVEDDEPFARIVYDLAHELGFQCVIASTAEEGLAAAIQHRPNAVVLDVGLPDHSGLSVLDRLKHDARTRHIPVHVVSGHDYAQTALSLGALGYMLKPVKREELSAALKRIETTLARRMRRVLVVEDDPVQLESVKKLLGTLGVETVGAATAAECLDHLRGETFDCMVLDLSLPDASGYSLLETLSREDAYSFPPVIVYTGRDLPVDEETRLRKYSKSIIIKGAKSPERLLDEVTLFLHQVEADLPAEQQKMLEKARSRDAALEGRRVLVVEDDVRNIFALTSILEPRGAKVEIARNGKEALASLEKSQSDPARKVDLVLMDVMMPEMDGLTATREIRARPEWKKLPVIMLTAKAMKDDQESCLAAGANDYMAKPLDVEKLLSLVRVWMPR